MNAQRRLGWTGLLGVVLALSASGSALGAPLGQISEFSTPTMGSVPEGIVAGPDGNLWFAETNAGKIGEINPTTHAISEFSIPTAPSFPLGIAVGPDGNIWFTESANPGKVGEINPATHAISEFPTPTTNSGPVDIVAGPDGNMWFTESAANKIGEISPTTHAITEFAAPAAGPFGITAGPDGNIWFTEKTAGRIGFISPITHVASDFATSATTTQPNAIAPGPGGSLWFTEQAANAVVLLDPSTHTMMPFTTPTAAPLVIRPGPDGNMWFTENANPGEVAFINPVTHAITQFATPTVNSAPVGITTGPDGNLWFTENANPGKVGVVGAGVPAPLTAAPVVSGAPQPAGQLTCQAAAWSTYAGLQPVTTEFGFDGFRWLLDGSQIAGATSQSFTVPSADVGHQISCRETVTYPLVGPTNSASSAPVTVFPSLGASLAKTSSSGNTLSITIACQGLPSQTCAGPVKLTSRVTTQGSKTLAVATKAKRKPKPKPPKKVTTTETVASGSYSVTAGQSTTIKLKLNSTGQRLLNRFYRLPASMTIGGTSAITNSVTLSYGRLHVSPAYVWVFSQHFSYATKLTLPRLPSQAKTTVTCHGGGCPFSKRTFATPKHGTLNLAPALKHRHLAPHTILQLEITAPNDIGEVVVFTVNTNKQPSEAFRCLPPGAHAPTACA